MSEDLEVLKWKKAHAAMVVCAAAAEKTIDELVLRAERAEKELAATRAESERWYEAFTRSCRERDLLQKELAAKR